MTELKILNYHYRSCAPYNDHVQISNGRRIGLTKVLSASLKFPCYRVHMQNTPIYITNKTSGMTIQ